MVKPYPHDSVQSASTDRSRVLRLRSEGESDELIIEEGQYKYPITLSSSSSGVVIGCTRMSWKAYDYIKRAIEKMR